MALQLVKQVLEYVNEAMGRRLRGHVMQAAVRKEEFSESGGILTSTEL